jgi:hypothetical protein
MYPLKRLSNPEIYQGSHKHSNYFEGWYYKLIDAEMKKAIAVIPGVSYGGGNEARHAFIQVLDADECRVYYIRFDIADFSYNKDRFEVRIGRNYFSGSEIRLDINDVQLTMRGRLTFSNIIAFPKTLLHPGIMGPYTFIPFMECRHGVINIHHEISGGLEISGGNFNFNGGYGYIEKDWGSSFPETWVWLQSNHFGADDVTLMFSAAKIPWLGSSFPGFISFIRLGDRFELFATYTGAKMKKLSYGDKHLEIVLSDKKSEMKIDAVHTAGGTLKAPKNGMMKEEISESITAEVGVTLSDSSGSVIYRGRSTHTGLEIANDSIFGIF